VGATRGTEEVRSCRGWGGPGTPRAAVSVPEHASVGIHLIADYSVIRDLLIAPTVSVPPEEVGFRRRGAGRWKLDPSPVVVLQVFSHLQVLDATLEAVRLGRLDDGRHPAGDTEFDSQAGAERDDLLQHETEHG